VIHNYIAFDDALTKKNQIKQRDEKQTQLLTRKAYEWRPEIRDRETTARDSAAIVIRAIIFVTCRIREIGTKTIGKLEKGAGANPSDAIPRSVPADATRCTRTRAELPRAPGRRIGGSRGEPDERNPPEVVRRLALQRGREEWARGGALASSPLLSSNRRRASVHRSLHASCLHA